MRRAATLLVFPAILFASLASFAQDASKTPPYRSRVDLTFYVDANGKEQKLETKEHWEIRRQHMLERMQSVMGPIPGKEKRAPLDVKTIEEKELDGLVRKKIEYTTEPGDRVRAWLFLPQGKTDGKRAAVLCLHQTNGKIGKDEPAGLGGLANLHYALELAQRGFVTLAPDYPSFGEHEFDFKDAKFGYKSGTMKAIWDNMRAIDLLETLPEVDGERIGCIGHSLGGHNTMYTATFDQRIKALVSCCGFNRFHKYYGGNLQGWTSDRYMPAIREVHHNNPDEVPFDFPEIVAGFAPRAFLAVAPKGDANFEVSGVVDCFDAAKPIYKLYGASEKLVADHPDAQHDFPAPSRKGAYEFLEKNLK